MAVQYSPLCDTDLSAYLAYCFSNGSGAVRSGVVGREGTDEGCVGGDVDDGGCVGIVGCGCGRQREAWLASLRGFGFAVGVGSGVGGGVAGGQRAVEGVPVGAVGDGCGGSGGCDSGVDRSAGYEASDSDGVSDEPVQVSSFEKVDGRVRGKWYEHNKKKKENKRLRKQFVGTVGSVDGVEKRVLQGSLERKWAAENALAAERARQQLELLCARDLVKMKAMQSAQVMRTTERCKVDTEKAFGFLAKTGNVPGFAETVVSGEGVVPSLSSGSRSAGTCISPDSSVSQQEIRQMQKDLLDAQRMIDRLRVQCPKEVEHVELNLGVKTAFTLNSDGSVPIEEDGCMGSDGKFHTENYVKDPTYVMTSRQMQLLRDAGCDEF
jgi:hypothetical protein